MTYSVTHPENLKIGHEKLTENELLQRDPGANFKT